ncbi:MAG: Nramp family divalent metal transporter [Armatimonadetes bacterium]|nr:Nramp family divalent metal transporter [Armatimonadota bacterium]
MNKLATLVGYIGPGFFVTVGFIDPGNWATNIAAGSQFGYSLLWVVTLSTLMLILWQHMSAHLGIITGKCLAEGVREYIKPVPTAIYGVSAMAACIATALAEILGAAIGINILFPYVPIKIAACFSAVFVIALIWFQKYNSLEKIIIAFVSAIGFCYLAELYIVKPDWGAAALHSVAPELSSSSILIAMAILGAVVMPHNMYLHSEVIQNREWNGETKADTRRLLRFEFIDTLAAMLVGLLINAAMVIVAAAVFHKNGIVVTELTQASATLKPLAGNLAMVLFGVALLFAGVSSSTTAGVAGGGTFSGYLGKETELESPWFRWGMLLTLIPAMLLILFIKDTFQALIISQVCLSIQLPLTMLPLYLLTRSKRVMGKFANGWLESSLMALSGLLIVFLNILLVYQILGGKF